MSLFMTATSFTHPQADVKNLFSLLLKLTLKRIQCLNYFASRISGLDLCFYKAYNVAVYYSIVTYYVI